MNYSIGEISKMFHLPIHTLRYYDSCGLFPFIKRDEHDNRYFEEKDLKLIRSICCLKDSNMPLKEIRNYINLYMEGKSTLEKRCQIFYSHKEKLLKQIHDLEESMLVMDKTINNYAIAIDEYHHSLECNSSECKHSEEYKHTEQDKSSYRPISERVNASLNNSLMISENIEMSR
jgi:DNA-binding transcriptional MerR regulator